MTSPLKGEHKCNIKKTQLFLIEIPGSEDKGIEEEGGLMIMNMSWEGRFHIFQSMLCAKIKVSKL